ncbi:hypothetical protein BH10BAC3_BH10BAC3_12080 [soil metagenome]
MAGWKGIVAKSFSPDEFFLYCNQLRWYTWRPAFVVLHNTAIPSLAQRPRGLTMQHIKGLERYYRHEKQWSAGPHLFVDDRQIWVFTPLTVSGVHSPSWNSRSLGVEMLGNYEAENFSTGRGLKVRQLTISALRTIHSVLGIDPTTINFTEKIH